MEEKPKTKGFSGTIKPGDVDKVFWEVAADTAKKELDEERRRLTPEENEKQHKRREVEHITKVEERGKEDNLHSWIYENIPVEFIGNDQVKKVFDKISEQKRFKDVWDFRVSIPSDLKEDEAVKYVCWMIDKLGVLSGINFDVRKISSSRNILVAKFEILNKMNYLKKTNKVPSTKLPINKFSIDASFYLIQKIYFKKLQDIIDILTSYRTAN